MTPSKRRKETFDPKVFLAHIGRGKEIVSFAKGRTVFAQGDSCDAVFYIQSGKVELTVVSKTGKEATIAILSEGDFFGEDSLARQRLRMATVTALTDCDLMRIEKECDVASASRTTHIFRFIRRASVVEEHPLSGRLDRPAFQFQ